MESIRQTMAKSMRKDIVAWVATMTLAGYFVLSGLLAAIDVDSKLDRIGLSAVSDDGKIAFMLIYSSLMVGIGVAMILIFRVSKSWRYSLILGGSVIFSFIVFRVVGATVVGQLSNTQAAYLAVEIVELGTIAAICWKVEISKTKKCGTDVNLCGWFRCGR